MIVRVIEPPAAIVTWEEAKAHLRVGEGEKDYVVKLIDAAQAWFDGPRGWVGHAFGKQTVEFIGDGFPSGLLPCRPISAIESIVYRNASGVDQTMPATDYRLLHSGAVYASSWPSVGSGPETVTICAIAGYLDRTIPPAEPGGEPTIESTVPASAKQAVLLIVGHWFANREAVVTGTIATEVPLAAKSLLEPFRSWVG